MADSKISPYSLSDLKNTTDDALGNYLRGLSFQQDNSKLDIRLALGYSSVIIAAVTFVADFKLGWEATKLWTAVAVVAYAVLNGGFTWWMWRVERGLVFEGRRPGAGEKISLTSKTKKHDPTYYLQVISGSGQTRDIQCPFTTWFTADGYFVAQPFQQWLASSVKEIGDADLKNGGKSSSLAPEVTDAETNGSPAMSTSSGMKVDGAASRRGKKRG